MRMGLFILSVIAFALAVYLLIHDLVVRSHLNHIVYVLLLVIILCNSIAGMFITWPAALAKRK